EELFERCLQRYDSVVPAVTLGSRAVGNRAHPGVPRALATRGTESHDEWLTGGVRVERDLEQGTPIAVAASGEVRVGPPAHAPEIPALIAWPRAPMPGLLP